MIIQWSRTRPCMSLRGCDITAWLIASPSRPSRNFTQLTPAIPPPLPPLSVRKLRFDTDNGLRSCGRSLLTGPRFIFQISSTPLCQLHTPTRQRRNERGFSLSLIVSGHIGYLIFLFHDFYFHLSLYYFISLYRKGFKGMYHHVFTLPKKTFPDSSAATALHKSFSTHIRSELRTHEAFVSRSAESAGIDAARNKFASLRASFSVAHFLPKTLLIL